MNTLILKIVTVLQPCNAPFYIDQLININREVNWGDAHFHQK